MQDAFIALGFSGIIPDGNGGVTSCEFGVTESLISDYQKRGQRTRLAQLIEIVHLGLASPAHIFQGLRRPMKVDGDCHADKGFLVYSWLPTRDCEFNIQTRQIDYRQPSASHVFVAVIKPFSAPEAAKYGLSGTVMRWYWVDEDPKMPLAPKDYVGRFDTHHRICK